MISAGGFAARAPPGRAAIPHIETLIHLFAGSHMRAPKAM
jgi:hypothetical protein